MKKFVTLLTVVTMITGCFAQTKPYSIFASAGVTFVCFDQSPLKGTGVLGSDKYMDTEAFSIGIGKEVGKRYFLDAAFVGFKGSGQSGPLTILLSGEKHSAAVRGFAVPLHFGIYARPRTKKFNFTSSLGMQYFNANLKMVQSDSPSSGDATSTTISKAQALWDVAARLRFVRNFELEYNVSMPLNSNFNIAFLLSLRYTFNEREK